MGGESYWHSDPPKLALMGDKGRIIRCFVFEGHIVKSCLYVYHDCPFSTAQPGVVPPGICRLVLIFCGVLIDRYDVLHYT